MTTAAMEQTMDAELAPPMSRVKQTRIDIWRNEVAALTLDTNIDTKDDPSSHSPPPSSATSSASSSSILSSPQSRGRRLWRRFSHRITGRPLEMAMPDVIKTDMYRQEQGIRYAAPKDLGRKRTSGDVALESSNEDGQGGLKQKQERLERAARLLEQGPVQDR